MPQTATPSTAPDRVAVPTGRAAIGLLVLLGSLTAIGPLSLDTYLPALPDMTRDLSASQARIQLSLTTCLIGVAVGQLVTGPLSDRWGRRRPVIVGLAAYTLLSLLCTLAPSAETFAAARFFQGFAGGMGTVVARAIVRDLYAGRAAAKYFSRLTLIFGLAPMIAPAFGSLLLNFGDWRVIFVALTVIGALLATVVAWRLPETLPVARRNTGGLLSIARIARVLITDRIYLGYTLTQGLAFAGLLGYLSGSSFVLQDVFGLSVGMYSLIFGVNSLAFVAVGQLNARLLDRHGPRQLLITALGLGLLAALGLIAGALLQALPLVIVAMLVFLGSLGMVMPNGTALALDRHGAHAGTAAALLGGIQAVVAAGAAPLVGIGGEGSALPMALVIAGAAAGSLLVVLTLARRR
ncbi:MULTISPECIES: multidrug effflux MFS transporter [Micromonospora]|uniref:Bcr/CflA subfamily drug resistance transporter n=1 Tax=Micromonospora maris TaxID=1003110 RepID=A0A9X0LFL4_9ACTN|nr:MULTISPECIES: multidrug effflux MFS transporter [Micromonospora]AEB43110.1 Bcr/CflA subfamily drug resistance transporter [Micromonospora maris AB-18-032]KUJ48480.1 Bcr/CflA subfamily drug resistance transporter [Micromonospora maris]RUL93221.1 Bcr/CflA family efflux MFS transporter [Verrucosispora sp. FIM060022]